MRFIMFWLALLPCLFVYNVQETLSLSVSNSSRHLCHHEEGAALLRFARDFVITNSTSWRCAIFQNPYPKIRSWKDDTDCCSWDGVLCDSLSGHVIELDLSCGLIRGTIDSNSSLFQLQQLQSLNLAYNIFYKSSISPKFGQFPHLRYLNLSTAWFSGKVPAEIANLSQLTSLDLSLNYNLPSRETTLELANLSLITESMTILTELHLDNVLVNSVVPQSLLNLSSLSSLALPYCGLHGNFPISHVLHLPHLRNLIINDEDLSGDLSTLSWTGPLEVLTLSSPHFVGTIPKSPGPTQFLRKLSLSHSSLYGVIPNWVWNTTEEIDLSDNQFSGELPSLLNTSKLSRITSIDLSLNMLTGKIPPWLFTLPSLESLELSDNRFNGQIIIEYANPIQSLWYLDLSNNILHGSIPTSISSLEGLSFLYLQSNMLNGTVDFSLFYKLKSLQDLVLSNNSLSLSFNGDTSTMQPQIHSLGLSSCNLGKFPYFLIHQKQLQVLELSNNRIHGQVPRWLMEKNTLYLLDLSYNYLTGGLENIPWSNLNSIDLRSNMFKGPLPQLPHSIYSYLVSNNDFTGEIPPTVCNLTTLQFLDLSNNSLTGRIPQCLGNLSDGLIVLNLRSNKFEGTIPSNFTKCQSLKNMNVNGNLLEGPIPPSLSNCTSLQVLDLGNNKLSGTFPHWLGTLTELEVLVLRSNRFEGVLTELDVESPFPKLRILDIANNKFTSNLPKNLIKSLKAMMTENKQDDVQYMSEVFRVFRNYHYMDSIVLTFKGSDHDLDRVLSVLTTIDVSANIFEGDIPDAIGDLVSLRWLNLSYNNFSGTIPSSLSNLAVLESFDISSNELVGKIPQELESLTSLEFFNVSRNKLVGPIPVGKQFNTFGNESYLGNEGLCGTPLSKKCGDDGDTDAEPEPTIYHNSIDINVWQMALIGYGSGMILGLVIGCLMFLSRTPFLLSKLIYRVEFIMEQHFKRRQRRRLT